MIIRRQLFLVSSIILLIALMTALGSHPATTAATEPTAAPAASEARMTIRQITPIDTGIQARQMPFALFDTVTDVETADIPGEASRTYTGQPFNLARARPITTMTLVFVVIQPGNYTNIQIRIQFWDTFDSAANPVFSNPVGPLLVLNGGPLNVMAPSGFNADITLDSPVVLTGTDNHGMTINVQADLGQGLVESDDYTMAIRFGPDQPPLSAGSIPLPAPNYGYYRNVSGRTDFNFVPEDMRQPGDNSALLIQLYETGFDLYLPMTLKP